MWRAPALWAGRVVSARAILSLFGLLLLSLVAVSCATYQAELNRGQRYYEDNEYERALAIWRVLESDTDSLSFNDQARYAYLRGMTGYRLGFRADARHWLGIAQATEQEHAGGLEDSWKKRMTEALEDLNGDWFGSREFKKGETESSEAEDETSMPSAACESTSDCPAEHICQDRICAPL